MEREQVEFTLLAERFGGPALLLCGDLDIVQHGADVNRFAVVAAVIFAESFHAGNFMQRRKNAKKFYPLTDLPLPKRQENVTNFPTQSSRVCEFVPSDNSQSRPSRESRDGTG